MSGEERRNSIILYMQNSKEALSGTELSKKLGVSRQVIVQDIALLKASGNDIISTNRGYLLLSSSKKTRVFKVMHTDDEIQDELNTIVDLGGTVEDVFINHKVYGRINAKLNISTRRKVSAFVEDIKSGKSSPLKNITSNYHYHTVSADSGETLDLIEDALKQKNYLVN